MSRIVRIAPMLCLVLAVACGGNVKSSIRITEQNKATNISGSHG